MSKHLKKALALLMCAIMLLGNVALADIDPETCSHDGGTYFSSSYSPLGITDNGDGTHTVTVDEHREEICVLCRGIVSVFDGIRDWNPQPHTYSKDGICPDCGAEINCDHPNAERRLVGTSSMNTVNNGDGTHNATIYDFYQITCPDCGITWSEDIFQREAVNEPHSFDANGRCICGEECPHTVTIEDELIRNASYEPLDANRHTTTQTVEKALICEACHTRFDRKTETVVETVDHTWNNGYCVYCGYECAHPDGLEIISSDDVDRYYPNFGDEEHQVISGKWIVSQCAYCDLTTEDFGEIYRNVLEDHVFDANDRCILCDYLICDHPDGLEVLYSSVVDRYFDDIDDDEFHRLVTLEWTLYRCSICNRRENEYGDPISETTQPHEYVADGYCQRCGHVPCGHTGNTSTSISTVPLSFIDNGDGTHTTTLEVTEATYCLRCNKIVSSNVTVETFIEQHSYSENSICPDCGGVITCTHDEYTDTVMYLYHLDVRNNGDGTHSAQTYAAHQYTCLNCYVKWYSDEFVGTIVNEPHQYIAGYCELCNDENTCQHPDAFVQIDESLEHYYIPTDERTHTDYQTHMKKFQCPVCDELRYWVDESVEVVEAHVWDDYVGRCTVCDYVCEHPGFETSGDPSYFDSYEPIDAETHTHFIQYHEPIRCLVCGSETAYEPVPEEVIEAHVWSEDGAWCKLCKYGCDHTDVSTIYDLEDEYLDLEDGTHAHFQPGWIREVCDTCQKVLKEERASNSYVVENHTYDAHGICTLCGSKNEAPTATPTTTVTAAPTTAPTSAPTAAPTAEPTAIPTEEPTAEPTEEPTAEPTEEPTMVPPMVTEEPAVTAEPTAEPTDEPTDVTTPEPTEEPTLVPPVTVEPTKAPTKTPAADWAAEPTEAPAEEDEEDIPDEEIVFVDVPVQEEMHGVSADSHERMGVALVIAAQAIDEEYGEGAKVEIRHAEKVLTKKEHERLQKLPTFERLMVMLDVLGYEEEVDNALEEMALTLSSDAQSLIDEVLARIAAMSEEEYEALMALIAELFPNEDAQVALILMVGGQQLERYQFIEEDGAWLFTQLAIAQQI